MKISIVGLGYVGLPLAVALGRHYEVIGFDVDKGRVRELGQGIDRTGEITQDVLKESSLVISSDPDAMAGSRVYIVTVPTPVDAANVPNLAAVRGACDTVGKILSREGRPAASAPPIIVFETFYSHLATTSEIQFDRVFKIWSPFSWTYSKFQLLFGDQNVKLFNFISPQARLSDLSFNNQI